MVMPLGTVLLLFSMVSTVFGQETVQTFTTAGTNTFTVPIGVTEITVECIGGGGNGGTRSTNGAGGGGGGGAYAKKVLAVSPTQQYSYTVGGVASNSTFGTGPLVRAAGGSSVASNVATGGTGGLAANCIGDVIFAGGNGATGVAGSAGGGGGGAAGATDVGGNGGSPSVFSAGSGNAPGGNGGVGRSGSQGNGSAASIPGGGGGGALRTSFSTRSGGAGAAGMVRITYTIVNCTQPAINASNATLSPLNSQTATLNWTSGDGTGGRIVVLRQGSAVNAIPIPDNSYSANATFGIGDQLPGTPGNYVVYDGTGSSVNIDGLLPSTVYHYSIFEYNSTDICYSTSPLTGSFTTASCSPAVQASGFTFPCPKYDELTMNFTRGSGTHVLVLAKASTAVDGVPAFGATYTASSVFGSGSQIGTGNFVVYNGSSPGSASVTITGLNPNTTYHFRVYEYNAAPNCYSTSPVTASQATRSPGVYASSNTTQNTGTVSPGTIHQQIIGLTVVVNGGLDAAATMNSITFTTTGTANPASNVSFARVYYTGTSSAFSSATQFGSTVANPSGSHTVNGNMKLATGTNYFWIGYDIPTTAINGNALDATLTSFNLTDYTGTSNYSPSTTSPTGTRTISSGPSAYCAGQPGTSSSRASCYQGEQITSINFGSGNIVSGYSCNSSNGYDNLTATHSVTLNPNQTYTATLSADIWFSIEYRWVIWIDWNQDGDFADSGERYPATGNIINYSSSNQSIAVPAGATAGTTRMRVWHQEYSHAPPAGAPCRTSNGTLSTSIGQVMDIAVNVTGTPPPIGGETACTTLAPVVTTPVTYAQGDTPSQLAATGTGLLWYTAASGGTGNSSAPTPSTSTIGTTFYYVSQNTGCEGPRTQIAVYTEPAPCGFSIVAGAFGSGTITPSGSTAVLPGGSQTYTFTPDCGYRISTVLVDGIPVGVPTSYTFTNVNEPHTISVTFVLKTELCNGIDDDCDGDIDEGCPPPLNDTPAQAFPTAIAGNSYPNCGVISGTLVPAAHAVQNVAFAGVEVWFKFTAVTNGVSITMNGSEQDNAIALYDNTFALMPGNSTENAVGFGLSETLNYDQLTPGVEYYISIGTVSGPGFAYSFCLKHLNASFCADGSGTYQLCSNLKAQFTGATNYTYNFTPTGMTGGSPVSFTGGGQLPLSTVALGLRYGGTYTVRIDANYNNLTFGNNQPDTPITILGVSICNITIAPHAQVFTKESNQCPATLLRGSIISGKPFVCAATSYTVEFTKVSDCVGTSIIGFPFEVNTAGASSNLNLSFSGPNQITNQSYYRVRWRPNFSYGAGDYGATNYIFIGGAVMENTEELLSEIVGSTKVETSMIEANLYPNPNNGEMVNLNMTDVNSSDVFVRIMDGMGRVVYSNRYVVDGSFNTLVTFAKPLSSGLYMVEFTSGDQIITERMIVER